ncbi:MAG: GNAT family N-acetyltransferase [Kangiellaceae bacterium]|nr:GNAT family N-acetyltransferase [Kangiellaceae bacterium]
MKHTFSSDNLLFYSLNQSHLELYKSIYTDSNIMKYIAPTLSVAQAEKSFPLQLKEWQLNSSNYCLLVVHHKIYDKDIGLCGFKTFDKATMQANMGVMLLEEYQSLGLGTEILKSMTKYCFNEIGFNKLNGPPIIDNKSCIKILEKSEYQQEALLRANWKINEVYYDTPLYTLLKEECSYLD